MEYNEEDYLMLSGIQHFLFCRRQWALIHIEQQWEENVRTTEGKIIHNRAHDIEIKELRKDIYTVRGLKIFSKNLGISGDCDVVEFRKSSEGIHLNGKDGFWTIYPIEYKRGEIKVDIFDEAQLCAQAMCLEEMFCCEIKEGALYYDAIKHRQGVIFTNELREKVRSSFKEMHKYYRDTYTPKAKPNKSCNACSLKNLCLPKIQKNISVKEYINKMLVK